MPDPLLSLIIGAGVLAVSFIFFWPVSGVVPRWQSMRRVSNRVLQEDALKHIQKMTLGGKQPTIGSIAGAIEVDRNQVVKTLAELEERGLLVCEGEVIRLSSEGEKIALNIIRAHRLWEHYLAERTGYEEAEWHLQADEYEHILTADQLDELARTLGNPTFDPHGDPIPTKEGELRELASQPLTSLEVNQIGRISHYSDEPEAVAAQIIAEGLAPGMLVRVIESDAKRVRFLVGDEEHVLAPIVASSIDVIPVIDEVKEEEIGGQPLNALEPGQKGKVIKLSPRIRGAERRRMMDLGILPGTVIVPEFVSPGGDPTAYRIREALIAIRGDQAQWIRVELV